MMTYIVKDVDHVLVRHVVSVNANKHKLAMHGTLVTLQCPGKQSRVFTPSHHCSHTIQPRLRYNLRLRNREAYFLFIVKAVIRLLILRGHHRLWILFIELKSSAFIDKSVQFSEENGQDEI